MTQDTTISDYSPEAHLYLKTATSRDVFISTLSLQETHYV